MRKNQVPMRAVDRTICRSFFAVSFSETLLHSAVQKSIAMRKTFV
jgi:hypothetical protein